jgi:RimJ/RimL family protein N-acetyltransferase
MSTDVVEPMPGTDATEIRSARVRIRVVTRADLDRRCAWPRFDDPVFDHLNLRLVTPVQREVWFRREWEARKPFWFSVEDDAGELIGSITLRDVSKWWKSTRLGIHMHPQRLDRGLGTEAMRVFLDYYYNRLGYKLMKLDVAAWNRRAIRCYEKLGFAFQWEFWRPNTSETEWLVDDRFAHVREHVERRRGFEQVRHYEMHLDAETFRRLQASAS